MPTIQEIIDNTIEAICQEQDSEREKNEITSLHWLKFQVRGWKSIYLKKNQPKNYFRVTRLIPPGLEDHKGLWRLKFQIWIKGKMLSEYNISPETFEFFSMQPGWEKYQSGGLDFAKLTSEGVQIAKKT